MNTPIFSPAVPEDALAIAEAEREIFSDPWSLSSVNGFLSSPLSRSAVAKDGHGGLLAYCLFQWIRPEGEILRIAVLPSCRRQGIGSALLGFLLKSLPLSEHPTVYLEVRSQNVPAIALYRSFGFEGYDLRKHYYQDPADDALLMRRTEP